MKFLSYTDFLNESFKRKFIGNDIYLYGITAWLNKLEPCDALFLLLYADGTGVTHDMETKGFIFYEDGLNDYELIISFSNPDGSTSQFGMQQYIITTGSIHASVQEGKFKGDYNSPPDDDEVYVDEVSIEFSFFSGDGEELTVSSVPSNYGYTMDDLNNMVLKSVLSRIECTELNVKEPKVPTEIPRQLVERIKKAMNDKEVLSKIAKWISDNKLPDEAVNLFPENKRSIILQNAKYGL